MYILHILINSLKTSGFLVSTIINILIIIHCKILRSSSVFFFFLTFFVCSPEDNLRGWGGRLASCSEAVGLYNTVGHSLCKLFCGTIAACKAEQCVCFVAFGCLDARDFLFSADFVAVIGVFTQVQGRDTENTVMRWKTISSASPPLGHTL